MISPTDDPINEIDTTKDLPIDLDQAIDGVIDNVQINKNEPIAVTATRGEATKVDVAKRRQCTSTDDGNVAIEHRRLPNLTVSKRRLLSSISYYYKGTSKGR